MSTTPTKEQRPLGSSYAARELWPTVEAVLDPVEWRSTRQLARLADVSIVRCTLALSAARNAGLVDFRHDGGPQQTPQYRLKSRRAA